ncbi:MAG: hypothetical protein HYR64_10075 [Fimbriimonas ginsengisoli]|uniref:Uncharacterized protein n=1 Tax=Fimbriimonas ginsengisoli TaxID=1005039 RepID=A0A931PWK6_FIMGI|nr:hypothetical protein [Fimbriimonas ginsengisoli]
MSLQSGLASKLALASLVVVAVAVTVVAQIPTRPAVRVTKPAVDQGPASSAFDLSVPGISDPYPNQKHEPLTIHGGEQPRVGSPILVSVSKANGEAFTFLSKPDAVTVYAPFYKTLKSSRMLDMYLYSFGTDRVHSDVTVDPKGSVMTIDLRCHRIDPDIAPGTRYERRPFLLIVCYRDPASGIVYRGETMLTLNGWVMD